MISKRKANVKYFCLLLINIICIIVLHINQPPTNMSIRNMKIVLPPKDKLAEAIKRLQYVKGVTNVEFAQLLGGVSLVTISNIRNGLSSYEMMAKAFHTLEDLKRKI
jgi:hypothetical protein